MHVSQPLTHRVLLHNAAIHDNLSQAMFLSEREPTQRLAEDPTAPGQYTSQPSRHALMARG